MSNSKISSHNAPPKCGNCLTVWAGGFACKYVELCNGDIDGCSSLSEEAQTYFDSGEDQELCPAFECDPQEMLLRAYRWIDRLESERAAALELAMEVRCGLSNTDNEFYIRAALNHYFSIAKPDNKGWQVPNVDPNGYLISNKEKANAVEN